MDRRTFSANSIGICAGALLAPWAAGPSRAQASGNLSNARPDTNSKSQEQSKKAPSLKNEESAIKSPGEKNQEARSKSPGSRSQEQESKAGGNKSMEQAAKSQLPAPGSNVQQKANGQGALYKPDTAQHKRALALQHLAARRLA